MIFIVLKMGLLDDILMQRIWLQQILIAVLDITRNPHDFVYFLIFIWRDQPLLYNL